jgi:asparagine synthase (glutamine-hydrolysing)
MLPATTTGGVLPLAQFCLIIDPDVARRSQFLNAVTPLLNVFPGLLHGGLDDAVFSLRWAVSSRAPLSEFSGPEGTAVLFGEAIPGPGSERADAAEVLRTWNGANEHLPVFDGFHATVIKDRRDAVIVSADILGMFPIYYWTHGEIVLIATSPRVFRGHLDFRAGLDPAGLVGHLLLMHSLGGRTLYEGVRRLSAGHVLFKPQQSHAVEKVAYRIPESDAYFDFAYPAQVEVAKDALRGAIARHAGLHKRPAILLSGGLDSRLVAAHVKKLGHEAVTFTQGRSADLELQCAQSVAARLGYKHLSADVPAHEFVEHAERTIRSECLANGFSGVHNWGIVPRLAALPAPLVSGYIMDPLYSPADPIWGSSNAGGLITFEDVFRTRISWGRNPHELNKLLRPDRFEGLAEDVIADLRRAYELLGTRASFRAWVFLYRNKARFHAGGHLWPHTFSGWPIIPAVDRTLLATMSGFPQAVLHDRSLEIDMLLQEFPELADLPVDRNSLHPLPLRPRLAWKLRYRVMRVRDALRRRVLKRPTPDRRYYGRVYDFNGPEWRGIRNAAEPYRNRAYEFFDRAEFDALLPPPDVRIPFRDVISESSIRKNLVGFLLWLHDNE